MIHHAEPSMSFDVPTPLVRGTTDFEEWRLDADMTRYRVIVFRSHDRVLVATEPDARFGRSWWALDWNPDDFLSDEYIAEKWRIDSATDLRNLGRLIRAALQRVVE